MLVDHLCDDIDVLPLGLGNIVHGYVPVGAVEFATDANAA